MSNRILGLLRRERKLDLEVLPPSFKVYSAEEPAFNGYGYAFTKPVLAKHAKTDCCDAPPLKYYPDSPDRERWWLICANCHHAIAHNGLAR